MFVVASQRSDAIGRRGRGAAPPGGRGGGEGAAAVPSLQPPVCQHEEQVLQRDHAPAKYVHTSAEPEQHVCLMSHKHPIILFSLLNHVLFHLSISVISSCDRSALLLQTINSKVSPFHASVKPIRYGSCNGLASLSSSAHVGCGGHRGGGPRPRGLPGLLHLQEVLQQRQEAQEGAREDGRARTQEEGQGWRRSRGEEGEKPCVHLRWTSA